MLFAGDIHSIRDFRTARIFEITAGAFIKLWKQRGGGNVGRLFVPFELDGQSIWPLF